MKNISSQVVYEDLAKAREGFVLASDLHLLYEVTPTYVDLEPDWDVFYQRFLDLSPIDQVHDFTGCTKCGHVQEFSIVYRFLYLVSLGDIV